MALYDAEEAAPHPGPNGVLALWGALKKIPQRLLEAFRYYLLNAFQLSRHRLTVSNSE